MVHALQRLYKFRTVLQLAAVADDGVLLLQNGPRQHLHLGMGPLVLVTFMTPMTCNSAARYPRC